jgi:site-specific DNA-methyltransferase (adenine-specific)
MMLPSPAPVPATRAFDPAACFADGRGPVPALRTPRGALYRGDCLEILPRLRDGVADAVFADPPFNLGKDYGDGGGDDLSEAAYVAWCRRWLGECVRVLRPGGAFFLYNLPRWNVLLGAHLHDLGLTFRHWIAVEIKFGLPIRGRLYPAHYSLLYHTKGDGHTFRRIRVPIATCRHCGGEIRDYGGHRGAMNPAGVNLSDVWSDVPPVRHRRFKSRARRANQLSTKILDRVVEMSTRPGDLVLDPFGGSGTTFDVCERKDRRWLGIEIGEVEPIAERLRDGAVRAHRNRDVVEG